MSHRLPSLSIAFTFDFDTVTTWLAQGHRSPSTLSRGEFEVVALDRVLQVLAAHEIQTTFFVPGLTAQTYPDAVSRILAASHEVGHHGWTHESPDSLSLDEEREHLEKGTGAIEHVTGYKPIGYRAPNWAISGNTIELLKSHDFTYDSSQFGHDTKIYWCREADAASSETVDFGQRSPVAEIPVAPHLDDAALFDPRTSPGGRPALLNVGLRTPRAAEELWLGDLDFAHNLADPAVLTYTCHPGVIGRGHRIQFLDRFLRAARSRPGIEFLTCSDIVSSWTTAAAIIDLPVS